MENPDEGNSSHPRRGSGSLSGDAPAVFLYPLTYGQSTNSACAFSSDPSPPPPPPHGQHPRTTYPPYYDPNAVYPGQATPGYYTGHPLVVPFMASKPKKPKTDCVHSTMVRQYCTSQLDVCDTCHRYPFLGWLYKCTEDTDGYTAPMDKNEPIMARWISDAIDKGHYTQEQAEFVIQQKNTVLDEAQYSDYCLAAALLNKPKAGDVSENNPDTDNDTDGEVWTETVKDVKQIKVEESASSKAKGKRAVRFVDEPAPTPAAVPMDDDDTDREVWTETVEDVNQVKAEESTLSKIKGKRAVRFADEPVPTPAPAPAAVPMEDDTDGEVWTETVGDVNHVNVEEGASSKAKGKRAIRFADEPAPTPAPTPAPEPAPAPAPWPMGMPPLRRPCRFRACLNCSQKFHENTYLNLDSIMEMEPPSFEDLIGRPVSDARIVRNLGLGLHQPPNDFFADMMRLGHGGQGGYGFMGGDADLPTYTQAQASVETDHLDARPVVSEREIDIGNESDSMVADADPSVGDDVSMAEPDEDGK